jgi:hypothetical protein
MSDAWGPHNTGTAVGSVTWVTLTTARLSLEIPAAPDDEYAWDASPGWRRTVRVTWRGTP